MIRANPHGSPLPPKKSNVKCLVVEEEAELIMEPDHSEPRQQSEKSFNPQRVVAYLTVFAGLLGSGEQQPLG